MGNDLDQNIAMTRKWQWWLSFLIVALIAGCNTATDPCSSAPPMDVVLNAHAFVDTNDNGLLDYAQDLPLEGAKLTFVKASGGQWVEYTNADGYAQAYFAIYCQNSSEYFPMTLRIVPPDEGSYVPIGPTEVEVNCCGAEATFLFSRSDPTPSPTPTVKP